MSSAASAAMSCKSCQTKGCSTIDPELQCAVCMKCGAIQQESETPRLVMQRSGSPCRANSGLSLSLRDPRRLATPELSESRLQRLKQRVRRFAAPLKLTSSQREEVMAVLQSLNLTRVTDEHVLVTVYFVCFRAVESLRAFSARVRVDEDSLTKCYAKFQKQTAIQKRGNEKEIDVAGVIERLVQEDKIQSEVVQLVHQIVELLQHAGRYEGRDRYAIIGTAVFVALRSMDRHIELSSIAAQLHCSLRTLQLRLGDIWASLVNVREFADLPLPPHVNLRTYTRYPYASEMLDQLDVLLRMAPLAGPLPSAVRPRKRLKRTQRSSSSVANDLVEGDLSYSSLSDSGSVKN